MTMMVQTSTDDAPELLARIEHRRANGLDRYDEWWEGVYRIVTGPSPEHGEFVVELGASLLPKVADARTGRLDAGQRRRRQVRRKVPDLGVFRRDTPRTSPAFLDDRRTRRRGAVAGRAAGEKLPFYASTERQGVPRGRPRPRERCGCSQNVDGRVGAESNAAA